MIERNNQRLSILCYIDIHDVIIKINIFDLNVHQTPLPHTCAEKEVGHNPTLVFGEGALFNIRLLQKQLKFLFIVGFDMTFIDLDRLHLEMWNIALVHKEMQGRYEVSQIGIDADIVTKR